MSIKGRVKFINKALSLFFPTLKGRVEKYFSDNNLSKFSDRALVGKTIVLLSIYLLPFAFMLLFHPPFVIQLLAWMIMGLGIAGVGMSVMHDANHGAYSGNNGVNYVMAHTLNLLGGSTFNWNLQHNILHHTYTNIIYLDDDINDKLVLRFSPHSSVRPYHRVQWAYAFFFYGITTLYWVTLKDFVQFVQYTRAGINTQDRLRNAVTILRILALKLLYFFTVIFAPILWAGFLLEEVIAGFLMMHFVAGIILTTTFQLAHAVEGTAHPLPNSQGLIENDWAIHQMNTTANFARENWLLSWYIGGLNYQVEHHLFPRISHVHYPQLSKIVRTTAREFGIPYLENKTLGAALRSHITYLYSLGLPKSPPLPNASGGLSA